MRFSIDNIEYELIIASDVIRDGLGIELWNKSENKMLAEIFRNDDKEKILFFSEKIEIPFEAIEKLIIGFNERVGRDYQK